MPFVRWNPTIGQYEEVSREDWWQEWLDTGGNMPQPPDEDQAMSDYIWRYNTPEMSREAEESAWGLGGRLFNSEELQAFGIQIPQDWLLQVVPATDGGYEQKFISPEGREVAPEDITAGPTGEWVIKGSDLGPKAAFPTLGPGGLWWAPLPAGTPEEQPAPVSPDRWEELAQSLFPGQTAGDYEGDLLAFQSLAQVQPEEFYRQIMAIGRTPESEEFLRGIFSEMTQADIAEIFGGTVPSLATLPIAGKPSEPAPPESKWKDIWDAFRTGYYQWAYESWDAIVGPLANFVFADMPKWAGGDYYNPILKEIRSEFGQAYQLTRSVQEDFWKDHADWAPRPEWQGSVFDDPSRLLDPGYIGYVVSSNLAPMLAAAVVGLATGGLGVGALGAAGAGAGTFFLSQTQQVYDEALKQGASEETATNIGVATSAIMSGIEMFGDFPFLKALLPSFMRMFRREASTELTKATLAQIAKKGIKTVGIIEASETVEEVAQQALQNAAIKVVNNNKDLFEGLTDTAIQAAIASLPFAIVGGAGRVRQLTWTAEIDGKKSLQVRLEDGTTQTLADITVSPDTVTINTVTPTDPEAVKALIQWIAQDAETTGRTVESAVTGVNEQVVESAITEKPSGPVTEDQLASLMQILPEEGTPEAWQMAAEERIQGKAQPPTEEAPTKQWRPFEKQLTELRAKQASDMEIRAAITDYVNNNLPISERGRLLEAVKSGKSVKAIQDRVAEVQAKTLRAQIVEEIKKAKPRKVEGIVKGRFGVGAQELLDTIRSHVAEGQKLDVDAGREGLDNLNGTIAKLSQDFQDGKIAYEEYESQLTAANLAKAKYFKGMTSQELQELYDDIRSIELTGRTVWGEKLAAESARIDGIKAEVTKEITGNQGIKPGEGILSRKELERKRGWLQKLIDNQLGFGELMSELNIVKGKAEAAVNQFERLIQKSRNKENAGVLDNQKLIIGNFKRIFGLKKTNEVNDLLNKMHNDQVDLGTFKVQTEEGVKYFNIKKTKAELIYHFIQLQDPTVEQTYYDTMKWTPEITTAIVNNLSKQEVAWADYMKSFLQEYWASVDTVYSDIYGTHLGNNPNYFPLHRDYEAGVPENVMTFKDMARYASVTSGSLKARVAAKIPIKDMDANVVLFNHIQEMEHFKAWAYTMRDLRRVFGDKQVKTAIRQYHGSDFVKRIDDYLNLMARGAVDRRLISRALDKIRGNFATAMLTPKPLIALQQIPAIFAYYSQMPTGDFFAGVADFWAHPIEHAKWMAEHSDFIRARYSLGMERDIRIAEKTNTFATWSGRSNFAKKLFLLIETGDKVGVFSGWWAKYKSSLKAGLTQEQSMIEADIATNRTQNTSDVETLSSWQNGGSFWKLLTMFQNQPNKYFRLINESVRNIKYERGSKAKSAGVILMAWVVLPGLYALIANAFRFKRDRFAEQVLTAPLNDLLVIGGIVQYLEGVLAKEPFEYRVSPVLDSFDEIKTMIQKAQKLIAQGKDPYEAVSIDDAIAFMEALGKAAGQLGGIPTPYMVQVEKAIRSGKPIELVWSQWALETPESPADKINKFRAGLGLPIIDPNKPETPFSEKLPDLYDMRKFSSDLYGALGHTLPDDITAKNGYDALTIAWAEMRKSAGIYETLPNVHLYEINTDLDKDDTIAQYYQQWQARLQITSLAELEEFDKLYPKAYLGNVSREQYEMLLEYMKLADDKERKAYLEEHTGLLVNPREEWLRDHPDDDARLAIWGQAKVLTQQAFDLAQKLIKGLELPADALDKYLPPADIAKDYFTYQALVAQYSPGDAEVKLLIANNDRLRDFLGLEKVKAPTKVLELQVKYRDLNDQYDGYGNKESPLYISDKGARAKAREALLKSNPEFADDRRRIHVFSTGGNDQVANYYVEYGHLVDKWGANSAEAKLYRLQHTDFDTWGQDPKALGWSALEGEHIEALKINVKWRQQDDQYEHSIPDRFKNVPITQRNKLIADARAQFLKSNPDYADERRRRDAYNMDFPTNLIENYVEWYDIAKPVNYDEFLPWYEDDWYLIANPSFYQAMVKAGLMKEKDFSGVPTRQVFSLYQKYLDIPPGNQRMAFRLANPDLDDWLVKAMGYKPAEQPKSTKPTAKDYFWDLYRRGSELTIK